MISTIGYEKADLDDFVASLRLSGIQILIDIRERAQSRRRGFSKTALADSLREAGIEYLHFRELGDPKDGREAARNGDWSGFRRVFSKVMASEKAKFALNEIEILASEHSICLMCYERDEKTCHRKIVSDHLDKRLGQKTRHLGVKEGASKQTSVRRVHDTHQGAAASI